MESRGVVTMFNRSLQLYNLRYRPMIADGDSSSYKAVSSSMPYGQGYPIDKAECITHYGKRIGSALRRIKTEYKGKNL